MEHGGGEVVKCNVLGLKSHFTEIFPFLYSHSDFTEQGTEILSIVESFTKAAMCLDLIFGGVLFPSYMFKVDQEKLQNNLVLKVQSKDTTGQSIPKP